MRMRTARLWFVSCLSIVVLGVSAACYFGRATDISRLTAQDLGFEFRTPYTEPDTGFNVGGVNSTDAIRELTSLNGIPIEDLEKQMRPGAPPDIYDSNASWPPDYGSHAGFLGDDEGLLEVLAADNASVVDELKLTHQELARPLLLIGYYAQHVNAEYDLHAQSVNEDSFPGAPMLGVRYGGCRLKIGVLSWGGTQWSPFRDETFTYSDVWAQNVRTGKTLRYSLLVPHMIERYGFYEGHGTSYRVDPRDIIELLELAD